MPVEVNPITEDDFEPLYASGELTRPRRAYEMLLAHPKTFLKKYAISIDEHAGRSKVRRAYLTNSAVGKRPGKVLRTRRMHDTESFEISVIRRGGYAFDAHYVRMDRSRAGRIRWYRLDNSGPAVMLTCKLTGCTFAAAPGRGYVSVTHIQPGHVDGVTLNQSLAAAGHKTYGRLNYDLDSREAYIVGVRRGGKWKIYAQKLEKYTKNILSVKRVYPS